MHRAQMPSCNRIQEAVMGIFDKINDAVSGKNPKGGLLNRKKAEPSDPSKTADGRPIPADMTRPVGTTPASAPAAGTGQRYTVKSGDSLSKIAKQFYGDPNQWRRIHEANMDKVPNPDLIHPGQELTIPGA
jgi:LysM repeat protein